MSEAGYPITVRKWKRGTPLESSVEVYRGDTKDNGYGDDPGVLRDGQGNSLALIERSKTTFESEWYVLLPDGPKKLGLPSKCNVVGLQDNQLLVTLQEDWTPDGGSEKFALGSVVSIDASAAKANPAHLKPTVVFAPTAQEFAQEVVPSKNNVLLTTLEHVQGRAYILTHGKDGKWTRAKLPVPDNQTIGIATSSLLHDKFFLAQSGFLTPSSVLLGDASTGSLKPGKTQKALFDASRDVVQQLEATSKDGTKVPYFVVHRKDIPMDGSTPTLLTAYGGFQVSNTPYYSAVMGKLWLERGGTFVLANIRGDIAEAQDHYQGALSAFESTDDRQGMALVYHNLGMISADRRQWEDADRFYRRSSELAAAQGDVQLRGLCLLNHTEVFLAQQQYASARQSAEAALQVFDELGSADGKAAAYRFLGMLYRETGEPAMAEARLRGSIELARDGAFPLEEAESLRELALLFQQTGRNQDSLRSLDHAHRLFRRLEANLDVVDVASRASRLEETYLVVVRNWGQSVSTTRASAPVAAS